MGCPRGPPTLSLRARKAPLHRMKLKKSSLPLILVALNSAPCTGSAADLWWNGPSGGTWNTVANWSTNGTTFTAVSAFPTASDDIHFNLASLSEDQNFVLDANRGARAFRFNSAGATTIQGNGSSKVLTIGGNGSLIGADTETILISEDAGAVTIGSQANSTSLGIGTRIQASQTWTNNSSNVFTVHNSLQSSASSGIQVLTIDGSGDTTLGSTAGIGNGNSGGTMALTKKGTGTLRVNNGNAYTAPPGLRAALSSQRRSLMEGRTAASEHRVPIRRTSSSMEEPSAGRADPILSPTADSPWKRVAERSSSTTTA
jgi:hypothetical protein